MKEYHNLYNRMRLLLEKEIWYYKNWLSLFVHNTMGDKK